MITPLEDRWGILSVFEQEHGAKAALRGLIDSGELTFSDSTSEAARPAFIVDVASVYASQSLRQGKEFFRHAENASWLVKPMLLYYGMMAVAKACLVFQWPDYFLNSKALGHGLSAGPRVKGNFSFEERIKITHADSIFQRLHLALSGQSVLVGEEVSLHELLLHWPAVQPIYKLVSRPPQNDKCVQLYELHTFDAADGQRHSFKIPEKVLDHGDIPSELSRSYERGPSYLDVSVGMQLVPMVGRQVYSTPGAAAINIPSCISAFPDGSGWLMLKTKLANSSEVFGLLEIMYLALFYFGSLARYHPDLWLSLHSGNKDLNVLVARELLQSSENYFLSGVQWRMRYALERAFSFSP